MDNPINTSPEMMWGYTYFKDHVMPDGFDYRAGRKEFSPYFEKFGFNVSRMYDDYYSSMNGISSDRYMSMDLYYFYVLPCLNKHEFMLAYTDKNAYSSIFSGFAQPETVVKNINGIFYDANGQVLTRKDAVSLCGSVAEPCIIKPTVETCNGDGVSRFQNGTAEEIESQFELYGINYIVQKKVRQHEVLDKLNRSSLNTLRVHTYRDVSGNVRYLKDSTFLRLGSDGSVKDNISAGGWAVKVSDEGFVDDTLYSFKSLSRGSLSAKCGVVEVQVPGFSKIKTFVEALHDRIPYFDFAGWDISISPTGSPVFIEFNAQPDVEIPQSLHGPMFGAFEDEVMGRVRSVKREKVMYSRRYWPNGFDHKLKIG